MDFLLFKRSNLLFQEGGASSFFAGNESESHHPIKRVTCFPGIDV